jgi:type IV secretory pathway TrbL component
MKTILKVTILGICLVLMLLIDVLPQLFSPGLQLVPEAHAVLGVRRRTARRTAVVVGSTTAASASAQTAAAQQQTAAAQQQAATAEKEAATAKQEAAAAQQEAAAAKQQAAAAPPPPPATGAPLPLGTVVKALPAGCTPTPVGGVEYYYCGGNFYRAVFQGNQLVYVTAKP